MNSFKIELPLADLASRVDDLVRIVGRMPNSATVQRKLAAIQDEIDVHYDSPFDAKPWYLEALINDPVIRALIKADMCRLTMANHSLILSEKIDIYQLAAANPNLMVSV